MKNIIITNLKPNQWELYKTIRLEALKTDPIAFADTFENASKYSPHVWINQLIDPNKYFIFAFDKEKIVGMMGMHIKKTEAIIVGVFVKSEYRKKGIGTQLLGTLIKKCYIYPLINKVVLYVAETQYAAMQLYKKCEFNFIGKKENYIFFKQKYFDELIMEKKL